MGIQYNFNRRRDVHKTPSKISERIYFSTSNASHPGGSLATSRTFENLVARVSSKGRVPLLLLSGVEAPPIRRRSSASSGKSGDQTAVAACFLKSSRSVWSILAIPSNHSWFSSERCFTGSISQTQYRSNQDGHHISQHSPPHIVSSACKWRKTGYAYGRGKPSLFRPRRRSIPFARGLSMP